MVPSSARIATIQPSVAGLAASANFQSLSFFGRIDSSMRTSTIFISVSPGQRAAISRSSLRGAKRRSNPGIGAPALDCFASLAMTKRGVTKIVAFVYSFRRGGGVVQRLAQTGALHARQHLVADVGKIVDVVDHAERQAVEAGAAQPLERLDRIVVTADDRNAGAADQARFQLVLVGLEPGVDARAAQLERIVRRLPVALLIDNVVMIVLGLLAGTPDHQMRAGEDVAQLPRRRGVAEEFQLRHQIVVRRRHRGEQAIGVAGGEFAAGLRIAGADQYRPAAPERLRLS